LNEFEEIVGDDLPTGLPPLRSISHQFDLIPRSSLPNKYPYRMTLGESKEVNRKVHKLIERGLIQESFTNYDGLQIHAYTNYDELEEDE
jgi:hypothetical protein